MEVADEAHPSTQIYGRNQRKTHQIMRSKIRPKNTSKNHEKEKHSSTRKEMIQSKSTAILIQIKSLQGVKTTQTFSHSLEDWGDLSLLSSLL
jgi:predicted glycosyltransferase involved in capsule biosynthesis